MSRVSDDPSWWPLIDFAFNYSYCVVASSVLVVYDWVLTSGQEFDLVWVSSIPYHRGQCKFFRTVPTLVPYHGAIFMCALPGSTILWHQHPVESLISLDERYRVSKIVELDGSK